MKQRIISIFLLLVMLLASCAQSPDEQSGPTSEQIDFADPHTKTEEMEQTREEAQTPPTVPESTSTAPPVSST